MSGGPKALIDIDKTYKGWKLKKKLDEGGFGQIYLASKNGQRAAFKAESNMVEGGSSIKLELSILTILNKKYPDIPHFPYLFHAAKRKDFSYMVVTLLGKNLRTLRMWRKPRKILSTATWARIALQALYCIKLVHDIGFIHRDVKPANFMFGRDNDPERARLLHILDFGMGRAYVTERSGKFTARKARATVDFRGTVRYCSPNVHMKCEHSRRDDLWSLLYMMIEFHCGLPWQNAGDREAVEEMKMMDDNELVRGLPFEVRSFVEHLRTLDIYSRPDYSYLANLLKGLCATLRVDFGSPYDWEVGDKIGFGKEMYKAHGFKLAYEDSDEFFASDPIGVNGPPKIRRVSSVSCDTKTKESAKNKKTKTKTSYAALKDPDDDSSLIEPDINNAKKESDPKKRKETRSTVTDLDLSQSTTTTPRSKFI